MMISHHYKFIFIANPKSATHAIRHALRPLLHKYDWEQCILYEDKKFPISAIASLKHGHITLSQISPFFPGNTLDFYFKFGFIRDPYERFVSGCKFLYGKNRKFLENPNSFMKMQISKPKSMQQKVIFQPQSYFFMNDKDDIVVDYVGKYENLKYDFSYICNEIGLNQLKLESYNESIDLEIDFDIELYELVSTFYKRDYLLVNQLT